MTSVPQRIGNYQLERQIGKGGMSEVWLGRHRSLENRLVAIKLLLSQDSEWIDRFQREANITSRMRHEHIIQIFDHGYQPPFHYTVMEYVAGGALRTLQKPGQPLPLDAQHAVMLGQGVDGVDGGARHEPEVTRVHGGFGLGDAAHRRVEGAGGAALERGVGAAVAAHAVDDVDALAAGQVQHLLDDLGRVLQVGVDRHHVVAARPGQARGDRRLVTGVGAQADDAELGPVVADALHHDRGGVGAAVVDGDDLVGGVQPVEHRSQPLHEER